MAFLFVISSGMSVSFKYLLILIANLSWIEVKILNHYPCIPSWPGVF